MAHTDPNAKLPPLSPSESKLGELEKKESSLWRYVALLLLLLAVALGVASWETLKTLPQRSFELFSAIPLLAVAFVAWLVASMWRKKREIAELRGIVRGMQLRHEMPPSEAQLEKLLEIVSQSQQGYRDLIDSFDDMVFTVSLDGHVRAANRSFADLLGVRFPDFVGHRLDEFIEEPTREEMDRAAPRFKERRHWSGTVRVRLRKTGGVRFYDCNVQAVLKDGEVIGASCLARDVTQQREAEMRFRTL